MKDYLLFIDTETSGIPKRWNRPYADQQNWPSVIQLAWIICAADGTEIKRISKYIFENDIDISASSEKIHGISQQILRERGDRRKEVLRKLAHDIKKYEPLIIGHFIELDIQVLSADYYRAQLTNPFEGQRFFCTMLDSRKYALNPSVEYLRLPQLYAYLFDEYPNELHEAEHDAQLTARCFLELRQREEITAVDFKNQQAQFSKKLNIRVKQNV